MAISYTKTNWQDAPSTATPITAAQLNRMEKGIEDCSGQGNANELAIAANAEAIQTLESGIQLGSISITQLLLMAHPIGSLYSSTAATSPADLFGGTWERIKGKFIWGIDDDETAGATGGSKMHYHSLNRYKSANLGPKMAYAEWFGHSSGSDSFSYNEVSNVENWTTTYSLAGTNVKSSAKPSKYGVKLGGDTDVEEAMPPYYGAYVWRRTA